MRIRAVVFDLFITLADWEAERRRPRLTDELAAALGVDPIEFSSLMRATFTERVAGRMGDARATFAALATQLGCDPSPAETRRGHGHAPAADPLQTLAPRAGVVDVIKEIRSDGYAIGVPTDCTAETPEMWPSLPYSAVVDAVTFSCEVGQRKPHPAGYRDVSHKLGVAAKECLYVGDGSSAELSGATSARMTAVLLETPVRY